MDRLLTRNNYNVFQNPRKYKWRVVIYISEDFETRLWMSTKLIWIYNFSVLYWSTSLKSLSEVWKELCSGFLHPTAVFLIAEWLWYNVGVSEEYLRRLCYPPSEIKWRVCMYILILCINNGAPKKLDYLWIWSLTLNLE
jgi:hypothetical protein